MVGSVCYFSVTNLWYPRIMCLTCGCGQPTNKHGEKTLDIANKKYAVKPLATPKKKKKKK